MGAASRRGTSPNAGVRLNPLALMTFGARRGGMGAAGRGCSAGDDVQWERRRDP